MLNIRSLTKGILKKRGYILTRVEPELPPTIVAYIRALIQRVPEQVSLVCFDNESLFQSEILTNFPKARVQFSCPVFLPESEMLALGSSLPNEPSGRFITVIDFEIFLLEQLIEKLPWLIKADAYLLRVRLGSFLTDELDLAQLSTRLQRIGLQLADVLGFPRYSLLQASTEWVVLACQRNSEDTPSTPSSQFRINEALTYLSSPVVNRQDFKLLAGRGSFGFTAGIFNPGAIVEKGRIYLLPRADTTPWALQKNNESLFLASPKPLLFELGNDQRIVECKEVASAGLPNAGTCRAEDFRLFRFLGQVFSNHSIISPDKPRSISTRKVVMDNIQTRVGISEVDLVNPQLTWRGFPSVDRRLAQTEKNWAFFSNKGRLFLLYSFEPYVLLAADNWPALSFSTIIESQLTLSIARDGLPLRNSINPVEYDSEHWFHVVHKVYPGKQYTFWGILIDKSTLRPVQMTVRPLICSWKSCSASIVYTCSVIADPDLIHFFSGLDDSATAVASISRNRLDSEWRVIAANK